MEQSQNSVFVIGSWIYIWCPHAFQHARHNINCREVLLFSSIGLKILYNIHKLIFCFSGDFQVTEETIKIYSCLHYLFKCRFCRVIMFETVKPSNTAKPSNCCSTEEIADVGWLNCKSNCVRLLTFTLEINPFLHIFCFYVCAAIVNPDQSTHPCYLILIYACRILVRNYPINQKENSADSRQMARSGSTLFALR
jgi:hypothetical protein